MENTIENKQRFTANYFGVRCAKFDGHPPTDIFEINDRVLNCVTPKSYLELTPLTMISDSDAIEVAAITDILVADGGNAVWRDEYGRINIYDRYNENVGHLGQKGVVVIIPKETDIFYYDDSGKANCIDSYRNFMILDLLRAKGYALPFHDLSVEDLVSYGWVKLKTNA